MKITVSRGSSNQGNRLSFLRRWLLPAALCCVVAGVLAASAQSNLSGQNPAEQAVTLVAACSVDANLQAVVANQQDTARKLAQQKADATLADRKRQLADDSASLLKRAAELKAEVDRTNKDMLSLAVIRKAAEIESLTAKMKKR
jgi:uncharacterized protein YlxW (UPF0749 family)